MAKTKLPVSDIVMILVIALIAIEHDGTRYEEGEEFELPAEAVKPLADVNAVKIVNKTEAESATAANASDANT
jgi:hypothetical protein